MRLPGQPVDKTNGGVTADKNRSSAFAPRRSPPVEWAAVRGAGVEVPRNSERCGSPTTSLALCQSGIPVRSRYTKRRYRGHDSQFSNTYDRRLAWRRGRPCGLSRGRDAVERPADRGGDSTTVGYGRAACRRQKYHGKGGTRGSDARWDGDELGRQVAG